MTPAEKTLWQSRLVEAENAYHKLLTGQAAVTVRDQNGESVTFNTTSITRLANYIAMIRAKLGQSGSSGRPMGVVF